MNGTMVKTITCMAFVVVGAATLAASFNADHTDANPYAVQLVSEGWDIEHVEVSGQTVQIEAEKGGQDRTLQIFTASGFVLFDSLEDEA